MVKQVKWLEHRFEFYYPIGVFPCVIARLRGTPARLEEAVKSLSSEILTAKINGGWSIQEMAGHLGDVETLHDSRLDDYLAGVEVLRAATQDGKMTSSANHNAKNIKEVLGFFRKVRFDFVKRLEKLDENMAARSALHPRLNKPMRVIDMAVFAAEHDDYHIARIFEAIGKLSLS